MFVNNYLINIYDIVGKIFNGRINNVIETVMNTGYNECLVVTILTS